MEFPREARHRHESVGFARPRAVERRPAVLRREGEHIGSHPHDPHLLQAHRNQAVQRVLGGLVREPAGDQANDFARVPIGFHESAAPEHRHLQHSEKSGAHPADRQADRATGLGAAPDQMGHPPRVVRQAIAVTRHPNGGKRLDPLDQRVEDPLALRARKCRPGAAAPEVHRHDAQLRVRIAAAPGEQRPGASGENRRRDQNRRWRLRFRRPATAAGTGGGRARLAPPVVIAPERSRSIPKREGASGQRHGDGSRQKGAPGRAPAGGPVVGEGKAGSMAAEQREEPGRCRRGGAGDDPREQGDPEARGENLVPWSRPQGPADPRGALLGHRLRKPQAGDAGRGHDEQQPCAGAQDFEGRADSRRQSFAERCEHDALALRAMTGASEDGDRFGGGGFRRGAGGESRYCRHPGEHCLAVLRRRRQPGGDARFGKQEVARHHTDDLGALRSEVQVFADRALGASEEGGRQISPQQRGRRGVRAGARGPVVGFVETAAGGGERSERFQGRGTDFGRVDDAGEFRSSDDGAVRSHGSDPRQGRGGLAEQSHFDIRRMRRQVLLRLFLRLRAIDFHRDRDDLVGVSPGETAFDGGIPDRLDRLAGGDRDAQYHDCGASVPASRDQRADGDAKGVLPTDERHRATAEQKAGTRARAGRTASARPGSFDASGAVRSHRRPRSFRLTSRRVRSRTPPSRRR